MGTLGSFIVRLAGLFLIMASKGLPATVQNIRLIGNTDDYINLRSSKPYTLRCSFTTGYDDPVSKVTWYKDRYRVYEWHEGSTSSVAYVPLSGRVFTSGKEDLQHIYFNHLLTFDLSGNYTCEVASLKGTMQTKPFHLVVLDVPSDDFSSNVTLLSEAPEEPPDAGDEDGNCTLLWDFHTPAIFPRPNVTCGFYSYLHDDVTDRLPSGLGMHLLANGSWQASFEHIHIPVADIPREKRLGCSVSVPDTSFKKVIKFEDNFVIDYLIDSEGCPSMFLDPSYGLKLSMEGGERNCRGHLVPFSEQEPLVIQIECEPGDTAVFRNGTAVSSWSTSMTCDPMDNTWRLMVDGVSTPMIPDIEKDVPMCLKNSVAGSVFQACAGLVLFIQSVLAWHNSLHSLVPFC